MCGSAHIWGGVDAISVIYVTKNGCLAQVSINKHHTFAVSGPMRYVQCLLEGCGVDEIIKKAWLTEAEAEEVATFLRYFLRTTQRPAAYSLAKEDPPRLSAPAAEKLHLYLRQTELAELPRLAATH